jgi:hypothetical protein
MTKCISTAVPSPRSIVTPDPETNRRFWVCDSASSVRCVMVQRVVCVSNRRFWVCDSASSVRCVMVQRVVCVSNRRFWVCDSASSVQCVMVQRVVCVSGHSLRLTFRSATDGQVDVIEISWKYRCLLSNLL